MKAWRSIASVLVTCCLSGTVLAADGPLGIDHRLAFDQHGIWARSNSRAIEGLSALTVLGGALWEGNDSRLGKTFWKASEAMLLADASAAGLKRIFRRPRPIQVNDPNQWFGSSAYDSFPSGEVTHIAAIVTPFIAEYARDEPASWALAALPLYVGVSRLKSQAHWQTDVLAGAALGAAIGSYEAGRQSAWTAGVLPRGFSVGFKTRF